MRRATGPARTVVSNVMASLDDFVGSEWEDAFRDHTQGDPETAGIGPWWHGDRQDALDAIALAGRQRAPVLIGEAERASPVRAPRLLDRIRSKAARLTDEPERLRHAIAAREAVEDAPEGLWIMTAHGHFSNRGLRVDPG